jgi:hypothetical protein
MGIVKKNETTISKNINRGQKNHLTNASKIFNKYPLLKDFLASREKPFLQHSHSSLAIGKHY